jgi:hypothetical protein
MLTVLHCILVATAEQSAGAAGTVHSTLAASSKPPVTAQEAFPQLLYEDSNWVVALDPEVSSSTLFTIYYGFVLHCMNIQCDAWQQ